MAPSAFLGVTLGLITGASAALGTWLGGQLADRAVAKDVRGYATVPALSALASIPLFTAAFLVNDIRITLGLLTVGSVVGAMYIAPVHAAMLSLPSAAMRATTAAILLLIINLIGLGLGPLAIGIISDALNAAGYGSGEGVRWALVTTGLVSFPVAWLFWRARRHLANDLARA